MLVGGLEAAVGRQVVITGRGGGGSGGKRCESVGIGTSSGRIELVGGLISGHTG